uniref:Small integral membrane protein 5 n=1 Tax=Ornithorhynchus anatinus TaxID=9258 RepID=A0A6I8N108_ORNAN
MAAQGFPQEMQSLGQKLLLRLKQLPQAEPVEIAAFSVILLFVGKLPRLASWRSCPPALQANRPLLGLCFFL